MLEMVRSLRELDFSGLMEVYRESNLENAAEFYPEEPADTGLRLAEESFYNYLRQGFFRTPGAVYALWRVEGAVVSALRLEPYRDGLLLEALETAPDCRRRGYAAGLIEASMEWLREQGGGRVYSHVHKRNTPSLNTHLRCGFRKVQDYAVYTDGSVTHHAVTLLREAAGNAR